MADRTSNRHIVVLFAITVIVYANTLLNGFVWDDIDILLKDKSIIGFSLTDLLFSKNSGIEYVPMHSLTLGIDYLIWGKNPLGFHLTNVIVFLISVILLYLAVRNIPGESSDKPGIALWTSILFAIHPIHAEPVNFVSNRCHLLALMFVLFSLYWVIRWLRAPSYGRLSIALICFTLSLLSKQSAAAFPVFVAAVMIFYKDSRLMLKHRLTAAAGFILVGVTAVVFHLNNALVSSTGFVEKTSFMPGGIINKIIKAINIYSFYVGKFFYPSGLTVYYDDRQLNSSIGMYSLISIGVIVIAAGIALYAFRSNALLSAGIAWYSILLLPAMNFINTTPVVADRYALIPSAGLSLAAGYVMSRCCDRYAAARYAAIAVMSLLAIVAVKRNLDWRSDYTLFKSAVEVNPNTGRKNYAVVLWNMNRPLEALELLKDEMKQNGSYDYYLFLGDYYLTKNNYDEAISSYKTALMQNGDGFKQPHLALAKAYVITGNHFQAIQEYLKVIDAYHLDPHGFMNREAKDNIAILQQKFLPQINGIKRSLAADPGSVRIISELALLYQNIGKYDEAIAEYDRMLQLDPSNWIAWHNKGLCFAKTGRVKEAVAAFDRSVLLNGKNVEALNFAGSMFMKTKDYARAEEYYRKAVAADPKHVFSAFNLGKLYFQRGRKEEAREQLTRAVSLSGNNDAIRNRAKPYLDNLGGTNK